MLITEIVVLISALLILAVVLNLVRLRRLREEYSWLWLAAAVFYLIMAIKPNLIAKVSSFLGINNTITAFVFFSLLFIVSILIHYSVRLSKLTNQMKDLAQMIALLDANHQNHNHSLENINPLKKNQEDRAVTVGDLPWQHNAEPQQPGE